MTTLLFDIETAGCDFDSLDEAQKEYLMRYAEREPTGEARAAKRAEVIQQLNLTAPTAQVIAIGMLNVDTGKGKVLYQSDDAEEWASEDGLVEFSSGMEEDILAGFWDVVKRYDRLVTFNGRTFDCPFVMLRSAILGVRPSRNLMGNRYAKDMVDLLEQLSFYGATRKFNLDYYCRTFGIESPKAGGITGLDMNKLFAEGRQKEIARYCLGDCRATVELYKKWHATLCFNEG
ncbi:MAG: ribonuclease H-like domain-containing protein [Verrucomicrobia bacterium]|nr:ribonuclease H-like domain-containing protein [Verrucomicrobiota bacterium]